MRGQYTHNHQVWKNARPEGGFEKFRSMGHADSNLATWLESEGYQTALIGKYLNGYSKGKDETYVPPGWNEWHVKLGGDGYYDFQMNENGTVVSYGSDEQDYYTGVLADKARNHVRRAASGASSSPFFMYLVRRSLMERSYRPRGTRTLTRTPRCRDRPLSTRPTSKTSPSGCGICPG